MAKTIPKEMKAMFLKSLLNKLKPKRKPKFNIDEKLRIGRELGNIIDFRTKYTEYRWTAIYEYFLFGHFTRYEIVDLTTSDSITFRVLEVFQRILIVLFILWKPLIMRSIQADNLQYNIGEWIDSHF